MLANDCQLPPSFLITRNFAFEFQMHCPNASSGNMNTLPPCSRPSSKSSPIVSQSSKGAPAHNLYMCPLFVTL